MPSDVPPPCLSKGLRDPTRSQTCICSAPTHTMPWWLRQEKSPSVHLSHTGTWEHGLVHSPGTARDCSALQGCGDAAAAPQSCAGPNIPSLLSNFCVRTSGAGASPLLLSHLVSPVHRDFQRFPSCSRLTTEKAKDTSWGTDVL